MPAFSAVLMLAGGVVTLASLVVVHLLPSGLRPLRDPVSQYGITRFRGWYWSAAGGAALAGVGGALLFATIPGALSIVTTALLAVFALARALIGLFPMDAPGAPRTGTGRAHNLLATGAFAPVTAAAFTGSGPLHDAGEPTLAMVSTVCGIVMAIGAVGLLVTARSTRLPLFGLAERLIYAGFIAWFLVLGVATLG